MRSLKAITIDTSKSANLWPRLFVFQIEKDWYKIQSAVLWWCEGKFGEYRRVYEFHKLSLALELKSISHESEHHLGIRERKKLAAFTCAFWLGFGLSLTVWVWLSKFASLDSPGWFHWFGGQRFERIRRLERGLLGCQMADHVLGPLILIKIKLFSLEICSGSNMSVSLWLASVINSFERFQQNRQNE